MSHGAQKTQANLPQRFGSRERLAFILRHLEIVSARVLWCYRAEEGLQGRHHGERTLPGSAGETAPDVQCSTLPNHTSGKTNCLGFAAKRPYFNCEKAPLGGGVTRTFAVGAHDTETEEREGKKERFWAKCCF